MFWIPLLISYEFSYWELWIAREIWTTHAFLVISKCLIKSWKNQKCVRRSIFSKGKITCRFTKSRPLWKINYIISRTFCLATRDGQMKKIRLKIRNCDRFWIQNFLQNHLWGPGKKFYKSCIWYNDHASSSMWNLLLTWRTIFHILRSGYW